MQRVLNELHVRFSSSIAIFFLHQVGFHLLDDSRIAKASLPSFFQPTLSILIQEMI